MTMIEFTYKVGVYGTLKRNEADMIYNHLKTHSDTKRYIQQGEFAFSFVNYYARMDVQREFSFQEIDKMLKGLEFPLERIEKNFDVKFKLEIIFKLKDWANSINQEYKRLRNEKNNKNIVVSEQ